jgi:hypothetical protein
MLCVLTTAFRTGPLELYFKKNQVQSVYQVTCVHAFKIYVHKILVFIRGCPPWQRPGATDVCK